MEKTGEDYLESCAQVIVDIEVVETLLTPGNLEVSLRYVLKHAEKPNHFVASRRWLGSQEKRRCAAGGRAKRVA